MRKVSYITSLERDELIDNAIMNGEILLAESNLIDGNFLTFCAINEIPTPEPTELELLQADLDSTKEVLNFVLMNL